MKILVCGGRNYRDETRLRRTLDAAVDRLGLTMIIQGGANGADLLAIEWAIDRNVPHETYIADWSDLSHPDACVRTRSNGSQYDTQAGPRRNQRMIDEGKPAAVIAFPGGTGTADMIRRARAAGIEVYEVRR